MSSIHHSIIGAVVPVLVKKAVPFIAKKFKLVEFDGITKERVKTQSYPKYYGLFYGLWVLILLSIGFIVLGYFMYLVSLSPDKVTNYLFLGLINMIGAWLILGAIIDAVLWSISTEKFRDFVRLQLIKANNAYPVESQVKTLFKLGALYYIVFSPLIIYLLVK